MVKIINNIPIQSIRRDGNDYLVDTNIVSSHYLSKDHSKIINRRAIRFVNDIQTNNEILFIRDDCTNTIYQEEIILFYSLIKHINPTLVFKFLLLSEQNHFKHIYYENLYHNIYNSSLYEEYINECFPITTNNNIENIKDISDNEQDNNY